jgi:hypothetical protein
MLADTVTYTGHTAEGRRIVVEVRDRAVIAVRAGIDHYRCATFGEIGPVVVVHRHLHAHIAADGRFALSAGAPSERLRVTGRVHAGRRRVTGTVRLIGSIATGQRCVSATLRYTAAAR